VLDLVQWDFSISGPGSLVASTVLEQLILGGCNIIVADGVAGPFSWQRVLPGPGRLPHLTELHLHSLQPGLQQSDMEHVVACCSSLQVLALSTMSHSFAPALAQLSGLTSLHLGTAADEQCAAVAQLTGLRDIRLRFPDEVSVAGLRQLAALEQLTSLAFVVRWPSKVSPVLQEEMSDHLTFLRLKLCSCRHAIVNKVCVYGTCVWGVIIQNVAWTASQ